MPEPSLVYAVSPDAAYAAVPGGGVVLHLGANRYYSLNESAAAVWTLIDAGLAIDAIVERVAREFAIDAGTASEAVARILARFTDAGLVRHP